MSGTSLVSSAQQKLDFMTLLITELQNQNPLEPLNNQQMASQLAQFTQLELGENMNTNIEAMNDTMKNMNASFEGAMLMAGLNYAKSLLGRDISFYSEQDDQIIRGQVQKISFQDNEPILTVKGTVKHNDGSESQVDFRVPLNAIEGIYQ
jgi:flagellar basal-body rod modification protein FlgD